ncbi:alpha/beta hydrolase [Limosilactobacillus fastidiosus]|uniref:Alpha/beta hydrolase n=1 Tax=Limosilactobacillus fastidiosus TaxID=2759855 RepID=A0ABR6E8N0_9LACO|nr:alpha/beta hydrolase [Limosilactobacillus fastidiosus]MBB1063548.1 alpha/beta hydrolase [Limosilactobacillus fastidiosus]MCD7084020.1 alpha/beta hydrolase [Limosilactobacillus fastidiosus]
MRRLLKGSAAIISISLILVLVIQFVVLLPQSNSSLKPDDYRLDTYYSKTPTIMIPGWGGNTTTYHRMMNYFEKNNYAQKVMTVWVSPTGTVKTSGNYTHQRNALIQVLYNWDYNATYHPEVHELTRILQVLHDHYHINKMNVIAHSYGGTEFIHAYMGSKQLQRQIQLRNIIFLGVPVEESFGVKVKFVPNLNRKSKDRNFHQLEAQMKNWKPNSTVKILNIMGGTDDEVPRIQSEMLQTLVNVHPEIQYQQVIVPKTNHFQLHNRTVILKRVAKMLWGKG